MLTIPVKSLRMVESIDQGEGYPQRPASAPFTISGSDVGRLPSDPSPAKHEYWRSLVFSENIHIPRASTAPSQSMKQEQF